MNYSPKLKKAMAEIKEIMDKHDINGSIILHSPGFGEHFMKVDASYSCAKIENTAHGPAIRIKAKAHELNIIEDTVNSIIIINDLMDYHQGVCMGVMKELQKVLEIDNSDGTHTTDQQINN